jgi:hypothetical protein
MSAREFEDGVSNFETWASSGSVTVVDAAEPAPDGSRNADRLIMPPSTVAGWVRSNMPISEGDWIKGEVWLWAAEDTEVVLQLVRWCSETESEVATRSFIVTSEPRAYTLWNQFQYAHDCVRFQIAAGYAAVDVFAWNASVIRSPTEPDISELEPGVDNASSSRLPPAALAAAQEWYRSADLDIEAIRQIPIDERARRLTQAVFAYCSHGAQTALDINDLFEECVTACGGYSYVLRGLLEATGARTRYVNLYNVPIQGNHTAVEVFDDGNWGSYDPTFGVYFTRNGDPDGPILGLHEVATGYPVDRLDSLVNQAREEGGNIAADPLETLFSEPFDQPSMPLSNYQTVESFSRLDSRELVILDIPLFLTEGSASIGDFNAPTKGSAEAAWLDQTNRLLRDEDLSNDVSFVSNQLSNSGPQRITTLTISGVSPGERYEISLLLFSREVAEIQFANMGRTALYGGEGLVALGSERIIETGEFLAIEDTVQFSIRNLNEVGTVHLLGVAVEALDDSEG